MRRITSAQRARRIKKMLELRLEIARLRTFESEIKGEMKEWGEGEFSCTHGRVIVYKREKFTFDKGKMVKKYGEEAYESCKKKTEEVVLDVREK